jgi:hypothetical protein
MKIITVGAILLFGYQLWLLITRERQWGPIAHVPRAKHPVLFWGAVTMNCACLAAAIWLLVRLLHSN